MNLGSKSASQVHRVFAMAMTSLLVLAPVHKALAMIPPVAASAEASTSNVPELIPPQIYLEVISAKGAQFPAPLIDTQFVRKIIPLNLNPEADADVIPRIIDHSISSFLDSPLIQNTTAAKVARAVERGISTDIQIKSEDSEIAHKFEVQMMALQKSALMIYTGITNARMQLNMETASMRLQINEHLNEKQTLVVSHDQHANGLTAQHIGWQLRW